MGNNKNEGQFLKAKNFSRQEKIQTLYYSKILISLGSLKVIHRVNWIKSWKFFIYKHTKVSENVQRKKEKKNEKERDNVNDVRLTPTICQNLSISTTDHM